MSNFTNSPLVDVTILSPNRSAPRNQPITKITVHHWANGTGNSTVTSIGNFLNNPTRQASYNYGIDRVPQVGLYVEERNRCWATSSAWNDNRAVVIGVANNGGAPNWSVSEKTWGKLVELCVDIIKRNPTIVRKDGKTPGLYFDNTREGSLTYHDMFSRTTCPGSFIRNRAQQLVDEVNAILDAGVEEDMPRFNTLQEIREMHNGRHFIGTIEKLVNNGFLSGSGRNTAGEVQGLDLTQDMIRMFVINDRAGLYDNPRR